MSMKKVLISLVVFMMVFLNGCTAPAVDNTAELEKVKEENLVLQEKVTDLEEKLGANPNQTANQTAILLAMDVIQALQANDMQALETYAHPQNGIRFSPYSFVDQTNDIVIPSNNLIAEYGSATIHTWGSYDGSGDPIDLTFSDYFDRFVYNQDFANPHIIGNNQMVQTGGNTTNNLLTVYPNAEFVEFHFTGFDPQYDGMDWTSLRIVMEEYNGQLYVIGIIHDEWTI